MSWSKRELKSILGFIAVPVCLWWQDSLSDEGKVFFGGLC